MPHNYGYQQLEVLAKDTMTEGNKMATNRSVQRGAVLPTISMMTTAAARLLIFGLAFTAVACAHRSDSQSLQSANGVIEKAQSVGQWTDADDAQLRRTLITISPEDRVKVSQRFAALVNQKKIRLNLKEEKQVPIDVCPCSPGRCGGALQPGNPQVPGVRGADQATPK